jgi:hypothetical protein
VAHRPKRVQKIWPQEGRDADQHDVMCLPWPAILADMCQP